MKKQLIKKIIKDPVQNFSWAIVLGGTELEAINWASKKFCIPQIGGHLVGDSVGSFTSNSIHRYQGVLRLAMPSVYSTWAHECTHCALYVAKVLGIDPIEGEEFVATYVGYMMGELFKMVE